MIKGDNSSCCIHCRTSHSVERAVVNIQQGQLPSHVRSDSIVVKSTVMFTTVDAGADPKRLARFLALGFADKELWW